MPGDTIPMEFIGGSKDGEERNARGAPNYYEIRFNREFTELYERQNDEPPFVYLQVGYARRESWR